MNSVEIKENAAPKCYPIVQTAQPSELIYKTITRHDKLGLLFSLICYQQTHKGQERVAKCHTEAQSQNEVIA